MAPSAKNKLGFVIGFVPQPINPSDPLFPVWTRGIDLELSWITNCLSHDISAIVIYVNTAKKIWDDLREWYSQSNGPWVYHLNELVSSLKQEQLSVHAYLTLIKGFWDDSLNYRPIPSCTCGANCTFVLTKILLEYQHYNYVLSFLMGLNDSFAQVRGHILLMEPLPLINKAFSLVQQDEKQRSTRIFPLSTVDTTTLL